MSDYTATGKPLTASRGVAKDIRDEFAAIQTANNSKADIASPTFTGVPSAPTAATGTATTQIATTDFVAQTSLTSVLPGQAGNAGKALVTDGANATFTGSFAELAGADFTGHINTARATVASHATTSAIWAASANEINFTGTETITDFPAADQAGSSRILHIAAACTFTHAGNISCQGGQNIVGQAGDIVTVHAITTTTFRVTLQSVTAAPRKLAIYSTEASTLDPMGALTNPHRTQIIDTGSGGTMLNVAYGSGVFVASITSGVATSVYSSPTGATWTPRTVDAGGWTVGSNGTEFIACDAGTIDIERSADGITWTGDTCSDITDSDFRNVPVGLSTGLWIIQGSATTDCVRTSNNGTSFATTTLPASNGMNNFYVVNDDTFWYWSSSTTGYTSTTGATSSWTSRTMPFAPANLEAIWQTMDGEIVIAGADGRIAHTPDGINWTTLTPGAYYTDSSRYYSMFGLNGSWFWSGGDPTYGGSFWVINGQVYDTGMNSTVACGTVSYYKGAWDGSDTMVIPTSVIGHVNVLTISTLTGVFG